MAEPVKFFPLMAIVKTVLLPIIALISEWLRDLLEDSVKKWYAKALTTENPWDDFFIERLAFLLDIELPEAE